MYSITYVHSLLSFFRLASIASHLLLPILAYPLFTHYSDCVYKLENKISIIYLLSIYSSFFCYFLFFVFLLWRINKSNSSSLCQMTSSFGCLSVISLLSEKLFCQRRYTKLRFCFPSLSLPFASRHGIKLTHPLCVQVQRCRAKAFHSIPFDFSQIYRTRVDV